MARSEPYRDVLAGVFRKALCHRFATPKQQACRGPFKSPRKLETYQAFSTIMRPRISICSA
jgi:hypothetical protein